MTHEEKIAILDKDAEKIRLRNEAISRVPPEEIRLQLQEQGEDGIFECFSRQRRFLEATRKRCEVAHGGGSFPNTRDRWTTIEMAYVSAAAIAFCNVKDELGGQLGNTVEECAQRAVDAEAGSSGKDRLIDNLRDEILDLKHQFGRKQGGSR